MPLPTEGPVEAHPSDGHTGALLTLALGTLALGAVGFMIVAILPAIASAVPAAGALALGQPLTAFALVCVAGSPLLTAITVTHRRRRLLVASLASFVVASLLAATASSY